MVSLAGFEPTTSGSASLRSIQLSYKDKFQSKFILTPQFKKTSLKTFYYTIQASCRY